MSGEACILSRNDERSPQTADGSRANFTASRTYSSGVEAIHSASPSSDRTLAVLRDTDVVPASVITGTPIQSVSKVVLHPLYGVESSAMSAASNLRKYSSGATCGTNAILLAATPAPPRFPRRLSLAYPSGTPATMRRERGSRMSISPHNLCADGESLETWLSDAKVTNPFCFIG